MKPWPIVVLLAVPSLLQACAEPAPDQPQGLGLDIAPLTLEGIDFACYDVQVSAGLGEGRQVVWKKGTPEWTWLGHDQDLPPATGNPTAGDPDVDALCSDRYGYGPGGGLTYIGPCDAQADTSAAPGVQNDVTVWFDGLYTNDGESAAELGDWQDPCGEAGCTLSFDCVENRDTLVRFDFTVMRAAQQGFFDIAVNFEDIFCSAKVDCSYDADGAEPIELLFDADGNRAQTAVAALACTAGPGSDTGTVLHMNGVRVECGGEPVGTVALPQTCIGGEAFGLSVEMADQGDVLPSVWNLATGSWSPLPLPNGAYGGVVIESIDDETVVGLVVAAPFQGGAFTGRLAMWRKSAGARTLASVATGSDYAIDFIEGFGCFGTFASGWCLARADGQPGQNVRWDWTAGVIGAAAVIAYPPGGPFDNCGDIRYRDDGSTAMGVRQCYGPNNQSRTFAYFTSTGQYVELVPPTGTAAVPNPIQTELNGAVPIDSASGPGALGTVRFMDASLTVDRLIHWTWNGSAFVATEISADDLQIGLTLGNAFAIHQSADPAQYQLLTYDGTWKRYTGGFAVWTGGQYLAASRLQIDGHIPGFGVNGMVYGRYAVGTEIMRPFFAYVPINPTSPFIIGGQLASGLGFMPTAPGDVPTEDAEYLGQPSWLSGNTRTLRVHYAWNTAAGTSAYVWELSPSGIGAWEAVPYASLPADLEGVYSKFTTFASVVPRARLPRCEPLIGTRVIDESLVPVRWSWSPSANGDTATRLDLDLPGGGSGGPQPTTVDLDPTVEGQGYETPRPGEAVWQYSVYRGAEALRCGDASCNKIYWNTAVGFDATRPDCTLVVDATASPAPGLVDDHTPDNSAAWPIITMRVPLTGGSGEVLCRQNPLNGAGSGVTTTYTQSGEVVSFCHRFDGSTASSVEGCDWSPIDVPPPAGIGCVNDLDCDDQNDCTVDTCVANLCSYTVLDAPACRDSK